MRVTSRIRLVASIAAAVCGMAGCGGPMSSPVAPVRASEDTTLGAGDVFDVRVFGETDLTGSYRVAQDGTMDFPLVGRIRVVGLEPTVVAEHVASALRDGRFLVAPQVSVFVREYNSKRVSVMGAVSHPGSFPMSSGLTVIQVIGTAGGFTAIANRNATVVTRRTGGHLQRYAVPAARIVEGQTDDFPLEAGDIVYVPENPFPM